MLSGWGNCSKCCPVCTRTANRANTRPMVKLNRFLTWPLLLLAVMVSSALAGVAAPPPTPDSDAAAWLQLVYQAFTSHSWTILTGLVMVGVVYPVRRWVGPAIPWLKTKFGGLVLAFGLSLLATLGAALAVGAHLTLALAASSLSTAAAAAGVWEWLKDYLPGVAQASDKAGSASLPEARVVTWQT